MSASICDWAYMRQMWNDGYWQVGDMVIGCGVDRRKLFRILDATQHEVKVHLIGYWQEGNQDPLPFIHMPLEITDRLPIKRHQFHRKATNQEIANVVLTRLGRPEMARSG
jgi:hypothetical protein